jgi:hypothetical protein
VGEPPGRERLLFRVASSARYFRPERLLERIAPSVPVSWLNTTFGLSRADLSANSIQLWVIRASLAGKTLRPRRMIAAGASNDVEQHRRQGRESPDTRHDGERQRQPRIIVRVGRNGRENGHRGLWL